MRRAGLFRVSMLSAALLAGVSAPAVAQSATAVELAELRAAVEALRSEQSRSQARIAELERALAAREAAHASPSSMASLAAAPSDPVPPINPAGASAPAPEPTRSASRLDLSGDARIRYEANSGNGDARDRHRGVFRARLRAAYTVNDWLTVGGQLATGDPDDPNSTDITLSNFDDDLQVSFDQAYIRLASGGLQGYLGKIPQPFVRTELVWDGDVSPQGASASYSVPLGEGGAKLKASGLYFMVDESVAGPDSSMIGGQVGIETAAAAPWRFELAASYYDYRLRSVNGADAGDFRSNRFANGAYLSDFDLLNVIGAITWAGLGEAWPLRIVGDYVHNYGAIDDQNEGFGIDVLLGRIGKRGDWRFAYGYAQTDVDAVLAAFSHDNTDIPTNYDQHMIAVDFVPMTDVILNATLYRYKPHDPLHVGTRDPSDWLNRLRLNMLVNF